MKFKNYLLVIYKLRSKFRKIVRQGIEQKTPKNSKVIAHETQTNS